MRGSTALELVDLEIGHPSSPPLLTGFSETFASGSVVAITGASGRGKSTLLSVIGLLLRPLAGRVIVGGHDAAAANDARRSAIRAERFGFVFQDAVLDDRRTILDNVTEPALYAGIPRRSAEQRAFELLERFGVALPPGRRPGQVSGGQAQRIALCRALLGRPSIVVADEPTGNLDRSTADVVVVALRDHADSGGTVVIATHDPEVVAACDRTIAL